VRISNTVIDGTKKVLLFFCLSITLSNCLEEYFPPATRKDYNYLVVDGILFNGTDSTIITLSRTRSLYNTSPTRKELNAQVLIEEENGITYTLKETGDGKYAIPPLDLNDSKKYRLHIITSRDQEYFSDFVDVKKSPALHHVSWNQDDKNIEFIVNANDPENHMQYYMWTIEETWKYSAWNRSGFIYMDGKVQPRQNSDGLYYCWATKESAEILLGSVNALTESVISNQHLFSIRNDSRKLYYGYSILIKQHALSKEAYEYWLLTKKNNEALGTLYDPTPSAVISNIHSSKNAEEPVLGYFAATSTVQKRILINRQEITGPSGLYSSTGYDYCTAEFLPLGSLQYGLLGKLIIDEAYSSITQELIGYSISSSDCIDCRSRGGTNIKPDFWD
jgi:hypothetical protein